MKKVLLVSMFVLCLAGCTPEDRVGFLQTQTKTAEAIIAKVDAEIPNVEAAAEAIKAVLADPSVDEATREKSTELLALAEEKIADYKKAKEIATANLAKLTDAIATLTAGGTITNWDELQLYGQIAQQIAPTLPPPWNGYVLIGSSLLTLIAGIFGGKKAQEVKDATTVITATNDAKAAQGEADSTQDVLEDVVQSVDQLLKTLSEVTTPEIVAAAKTALRAQSPDTQATVKFIKANA